MPLRPDTAAASQLPTLVPEPRTVAAAVAAAAAAAAA
jgi:hypothetical protein